MYFIILYTLIIFIENATIYVEFEKLQLCTFFNNYFLNESAVT